MRKTLIALAALAAGAAASMAQESAPTGPPPVIAIGREEIPPGRMPAHERNAAGFVSVLNRTGAATHRIALVPLSGDDNQVLYLEPYASFADFEQARQRFDQAVASNAALRTEMEQLQRDNAQLHNSQRTTLARYRADLSYRPKSAEDTARSRYFSITTVRLKPGRGPDYVEYIKQGNAARAKANIDDHTAVYQVVSGAPFGTFLIFSSLKSLKEWDDGFARTQQEQKVFEEALGGPVVAAGRRQLLAEIAAEAVNTLFAISPAMSRPTARMAALDPDFWTPKPVVASGKALAVKKAATKEQPKP
jgi:hypothetical protein